MADVTEAWAEAWAIYSGGRCCLWTVARSARRAWDKLPEGGIDIETAKASSNYTCHAVRIVPYQIRPLSATAVTGDVGEATKKITVILDPEGGYEAHVRVPGDSASGWGETAEQAIAKAEARIVSATTTPTETGGQGE